ncbi:sigma-B regulation protein RsbQ [Mucilaginibacter pineti]|uniref:Sigma-B regulation protein RsbQ n=1 Tax=Mucilaginibacter pineti TaxID=1391627 RepID=A0A1G6X784_9SPHI|nr:alpha/beta hydrolase [Mucilaginibacter pineti]SDD73186.1 sigma-B regulation protein RsbQ [Mucilaginibacter pineti]
MTCTIKKKNNVVIEGNLDATKTLVFAHGFGTDQTAWNWVKEFFEDDYRLVLFDNVGAGNADPDAYNSIKYNNLKTYANDLLDILADLELWNATIIAHSVSCMITLLAASKAPEHFSKMVFLNASARYLNDDSANYIGGFTQDALNGMYNAMASNYYAWASGFSVVAMGNTDRPQLGEQFAYTLSAVRPDVALSAAKIIFESDVRNELDKLDKQVLLLQSSEDIAVPTAATAYLHQHIKGSKLQYLRATGHFPHISAPAEVAAAIKSFI